MNDRMSAQLAETQHSLREQLSAAQTHFERLEQLLAARESHEIASLNHSVRRLRSGEERWSNVLVEATRRFADRAALFTLQGSWLHFEAARNAATAIPDVPLHSAPAFRSAVESRDTVVAMRTRSEMSAPIASSLGESASGRFYLFPVVTREHVEALLYADAGQGSVQADALELLAALAGAVIENRASASANGLVHIADDLNLKAQRLARVQVADIRLHKSEEVKNGRAERDLYASLKPEIDSAREIFRRDFLSTPGTTVDYLHLELVRTLAIGDAALLGPGYPGPMVQP